MGLYDLSFYDVINRNAICFRRSKAWLEVDDNSTRTFAEYKDEVDRLAAGLQRLGIGRGDRVGVIGKNGLRYFFVYGAVAALGAVLVPINWRLSTEELVYNLSDAEPKIIFADLEFLETMKVLRERLSSVDQYFSLGDGKEDFAEYRSLLELGDDFGQLDISTDDGLVIIYTAAVSGKPRGALLSHGNVLSASMQLIASFGFRSDAVHLSYLPFFHVGGLFMATSVFHAGGVNVNMSKFDATKAMDLIEKRKVSFMFNFSPVLSAVLEQHEKTGKDIKTLKAVGGLDSPEMIKKYQKLTGGTFYCMYAQTETSGVGTFGSYNDRPGSAGRTIPLADLRLVDEYDHPVPMGSVGEITMKGPTVFRGYWNRPEDSNFTFRGGWHHTGDLGRFDEDGFFWYEGRKPEKELIKTGGENVYPAEVEGVILQHPSVERCVVFGVPDPKWHEAIKAVCQLKNGQELDSKELTEFVCERLARFKRPQHITFVDEFPVLENGLPDRSKIKEMYGKL